MISLNYLKEGISATSGRANERRFNRTQLKEALIDIWDNEISAEEHFNKYIDSMPERLEKVRLRKGAQTPY